MPWSAIFVDADGPGGARQELLWQALNESCPDVAEYVRFAALSLEEKPGTLSREQRLFPAERPDEAAEAIHAAATDVVARQHAPEERTNIVFVLHGNGMEAVRRASFLAENLRRVVAEHNVGYLFPRIYGVFTLGDAQVDWEQLSSYGESWQRLFILQPSNLHQQARQEGGGAVLAPEDQEALAVEVILALVQPEVMDTLAGENLGVNSAGTCTLSFPANAIAEELSNNHAAKMLECYNGRQDSGPHGGWDGFRQIEPDSLFVSLTEDREYGSLFRRLRLDGGMFRAVQLHLIPSRLASVNSFIASHIRPYVVSTLRKRREEHQRKVVDLLRGRVDKLIQDPETGSIHQALGFVDAATDLIQRHLNHARQPGIVRETRNRLRERSGYEFEPCDNASREYAQAEERFRQAIAQRPLHLATFARFALAGLAAGLLAQRGVELFARLPLLPDPGLMARFPVVFLSILALSLVLGAAYWVQGWKTISQCQTEYERSIAAYHRAKLEEAVRDEMVAFYEGLLKELGAQERENQDQQSGEKQRLMELREGLADINKSLREPGEAGLRTRFRQPILDFADEATEIFPNRPSGLNAPAVPPDKSLVDFLRQTPSPLDDWRNLDSAAFIQNLLEHARAGFDYVRQLSVTSLLQEEEQTARNMQNHLRELIALSFPYIHHQPDPQASGLRSWLLLCPDSDRVKDALGVGTPDSALEVNGFQTLDCRYRKDIAFLRVMVSPSLGGNSRRAAQDTAIDASASGEPSVPPI